MAVTVSATQTTVLSERMSGVVSVIKPGQFPWEETRRRGAVVHLAGCLAAETAVIEAALKGDMDLLCALLKREPETFGLIVDTGTHVIAATDRIRGYPVYVRTRNSNVEIAANTSRWVTSDHAGEFDEERAGRFLAAGYTIGSDTLFGSVRRLLGGEIVTLDKATGQAEYRRHSMFRPAFAKDNESERYWEDRLETAFDGAIRRVMARAGGAPIWVPLSAGYDSRAVLAKLLALGYDRVETFSYGVPGNMEARVASEIAGKAGVPWRQISSMPPHPREAFSGEDVEAYYFSASGLGTTPAMTEFFPLRNMLAQGIIAEGDFVVNGQTGDFLTGGHIPAIGSIGEAGGAILDKHMALLRSEKESIGREGADELLRDWARTYLDISTESIASQADALSLCVAFEGQERQSQYIVQQQRLYDFLGLRWTLPLWDGELMDLFQAAPLNEHSDQSLYLRYLRRWNYLGLFDEGRRPHNPWPRHKMAITTAARLAGLLGGKSSKERAYKHLYFWSEQHYLYALFGRGVYRGLIDELRGPVSLFALDFMSRLRRRLGLEPRRPAEIAYAKLQNIAAAR